MESITQIRIRGHLVGLVGLNEAIEKALELELSHEAVSEFLLQSVKGKNYIPPHVEEDYRKAIYRFYCQQAGLPVEDKEESQALRIRILGPGCPRCDRLEQEVRAVLTEMETPADVEHVRDREEIASFGVKGSPALVVNDQVRSIGTIPKRDQIRQWIEEAHGAG